MDYNVWSCGEYNQNTTGFEGRLDAIRQVSSSFSSIGENSLKVIRKNELYGTSCQTRLSNLTGTNNITATMVVYSPNNPVQINLNNGSTLTSVTCPASSTVSIVSLSAVVDSEYVDLRIFLDQPDYFVFIDNINISY